MPISRASSAPKAGLQTGRLAAIRCLSTPSLQAPAAATLQPDQCREASGSQSLNTISHYISHDYEVIDPLKNIQKPTPNSSKEAFRALSAVTSARFVPGRA